MREDATHRLAFEYLHECFAASQSASSLRIREAICISLKGRSSIGFDIEKSSSPSIQIPAVRKSSPSVSRAELSEVRTSAIYQQIRRFEVFAACRCSFIAWRTVVPFAVSTRSRTELNLEILVVAAMMAVSS